MLWPSRRSGAGARTPRADPTGVPPEGRSLSIVVGRERSEVARAEPVAAPAFGFVEGSVGAGHEGGEAGRPRKRARCEQGGTDADTRPHRTIRHRGAPGGEAGTDRIPEILHVPRRDVGDEDGELVPTEPAQHRRPGQGLTQHPRQRDEEAVADEMAEAVIDALEAVDVEEQQGARPRPGPAQAASARLSKARRLKAPVRGSRSASAAISSSRRRRPRPPSAGRGAPPPERPRTGRSGSSRP